MDIEKKIQKIMDEKKISREEIKKKITEQIEELSGLIDEEGAIVIVAKNLGVDLQDNQSAANMEKDTPIGKLSERLNATIVGRIIQIQNVKKFNKKDGSEGVLLPFIIKDTSGMIKCLAWGTQHAQIKETPQFSENEIIRIINGFVKIGRDGMKEFHIGNRSALQLAPDQVDHTLIPEVPKSKGFTITPLDKLSLSMPIIHIRGDVEGVFPSKKFARKDGSQGERASLSIRDGAQTVYITFWGEHCKKLDGIQPGQNIEISNLSPKKNFRNPELIDLTATSSTLLNVLKESSGNATIETIISIQSILDSKGSGTIEGKIQTIEEQLTVKLRDGTEKELMKIAFADDSNAIRIVLWGDHIKPFIKPGNSLRLTKVYVKENNYSNQLEGNLTRLSQITQIDKNFSTTQILAPAPSSAPQSSNERKPIKEIDTNGFFTFKGTIIEEIKFITIYDACSTCNKKYENCKCSSPGDQVKRMILNLNLDDGTSFIRGSLIGETAESFLGVKADEVGKFKENDANEGTNEFDLFLQNINKEIAGTEYIFSGKARYSDYSSSYEINIRKFQPLDPLHEAEQLLSLIES